MFEKADALGDNAGNSAKIEEVNRILFEKYPRLGRMDKHVGKISVKLDRNLHHCVWYLHLNDLPGQVGYLTLWNIAI